MVKTDLPFGTSDHSQVKFCINIDDDTSLPLTSAGSECFDLPGRPDFTRADWLSIQQYMKNVNWSNVFAGSMTCNDLARSFYDVLNECIELYVPVLPPVSKNANKTDRKYPSKVRKLLRKKRDLWRRLKRFKTPEITAKYREACFSYRAALIEADRKFEESLVESCNLGKFFRYASSKFTGRKNVASLLNKDGLLVSDPTAKAYILSEQFMGQFTGDDARECAMNSRANSGSLGNVTFSPVAIKKAISKLKTNAAAGPDYIPPICADSIVVPLSFLFNHFLRTAICLLFG